MIEPFHVLSGCVNTQGSVQTVHDPVLIIIGTPPIYSSLH